MSIREFTPSFEVIYEHKDMDEEGEYKCLICGAIWRLKSIYTDRPPYTCHAERIS